MQNLLADLVLESEAATLTAFRLAEAFDRSASDPNEWLLAREFADCSNLESRVRRLVELAACALQASLMLRHAYPRAAAAFCTSRLGGDWGHVPGTLPAGTDCASLIARPDILC